MSPELSKGFSLSGKKLKVVYNLTPFCTIAPTFCKTLQIATSTLSCNLPPTALNRLWSVCVFACDQNAKTCVCLSNRPLGQTAQHMKYTHSVPSLLPKALELWTRSPQHAFIPARGESSPAEATIPHSMFWTLSSPSARLFCEVTSLVTRQSGDCKIRQTDKMVIILYYLMKV